MLDLHDGVRAEFADAARKGTEDFRGRDGWQVARRQSWVCSACGLAAGHEARWGCRPLLPVSVSVAPRMRGLAAHERRALKRARLRAGAPGL